MRVFVTDRISEVVENQQLLHWREEFSARYLQGELEMVKPILEAVINFYDRTLALPRSIERGDESAATDIPMEYLKCLFADDRISVKMAEAYRQAHEYFRQEKSA